jgi:hypothetical protein
MYDLASQKSAGLPPPPRSIRRRTGALLPINWLTAIFVVILALAGAVMPIYSAMDSRTITNGAVRSAPVVPAVLFAAIWLSLFCVIGYVVCLPWIRQRGLVRNGTATVGKVTGDREVLARQGNNSWFLVLYTFATSDGREISAQMRISRRAYNDVEANLPVTVLYDPARPSRSVAYEFCMYEIER